MFFFGGGDAIHASLFGLVFLKACAVAKVYAIASKIELMIFVLLNFS